MNYNLNFCAAGGEDKFIISIRPTLIVNQKCSTLNDSNHSQKWENDLRRRADLLCCRTTNQTQSSRVELSLIH